VAHRVQENRELIEGFQNDDMFLHAKDNYAKVYQILAE